MQHLEPGLLVPVEVCPDLQVLESRTVQGLHHRGQHDRHSRAAHLRDLADGDHLGGILINPYVVEVTSLPRKIQAAAIMVNLIVIIGGGTCSLDIIQRFVTVFYNLAITVENINIGVILCEIKLV